MPDEIVEEEITEEVRCDVPDQRDNDVDKGEKEAVHQCQLHHSSEREREREGGGGGGRER